jgi:hypothetical protein
MAFSAEQFQILRTLAILRPLNVTCGKVRIGGPNDGGYVMANDFKGNTLCYSIGVGPQVIWDHEMANRSMHVYQYDHTVERAPSDHPSFHFHKIGVAPNLSDPQMITLERMLEDNDHCDEDHMLLKIDIEGFEWDVLDGMSSNLLSKFDQIVVEFHGLQFLDRDSFQTRAERVFKNLAHSHACIHIHGNNYGGFSIIKNVPVPNVIEVTYALRSRFDFIESTDIFPTHLDDPCKSDEPDLFLGDFKYRCS